MGSGKAPWGATRYGQPGSVSNPNFKGDPSEYESYDRSPLVNQMVTALNKDSNLTQAKAMARASQMGAGQSAFANRNVQNIMSDTDNRKAQVRAQASEKGWDDIMRQMQMENSFNLSKAGLDLDKFKTEAGLAEAERAQRREALKLLGPYGQAAGLFTGY